MSVFAGTNALSAIGVSSGISLDPTARMSQVLIDLSAFGNSTAIAGAGDVTIQATLDVWTSTWSGQSVPSWNNISTSHYSSASYPTTGCMTIVSPVAGLRLSSSTWTGIGTVTLKALQEILA